MALPSDLKVDNLNFEGIKANLVNYLRAQDQFRDYNFDAAGIQVLLDLLSYNTYYNSFYLNMIANENFLATAQKRNSVVNLARSLNYTPRSTTSATISGLAVFSVTGSPASITIPAYTTFDGTLDGQTYSFNTTEATTIVPASGVYSTDITLTEGRHVTQRYTVNVSNPDQRFLLSNSGADTSTLIVRVQASSVDTTISLFTLPDNLIEVTGTDDVYFLEEVEDGQYEVFFGDGTIGSALENGNIVILDYLVSNGKLANDIQNLTFSGTVNDVTDAVFVQDAASAGGAERETINKIKFNAPKAYEAQNRAITAEDYKALLLKQSNVGSVSVWGGEDNDPPAYGKVYIAVKPTTGEVLTASEKDNLKVGIIKPKKVLTVQTEFVDPEYIYLIISAVVNYDSRIAAISDTSLEQKIIAVIQQYNDDDISEFSKYFRYSKLSRLIDLSDRSILNSTINVTMRKELDVQLGTSKRYEILFSNAINDTTSGRPATHPYGIGNQLSSNEFSISGYDNCFLEENDGIIRIYRVSGGANIAVSSNAGTLNYTTGKVILNNFGPTAFADGGVTLKLTSVPKNLDILPLRNQIIAIRDADIEVSVVDDRTISLVNR